MVLVCIITINTTSSTGSKCENSISLVLIDICVNVSTSDGNRGPWPAFGYSLMMTMMMMMLCGERRSGGSKFQTTGAAMKKLRWPMDVLARETNRLPRPAERSDRRDKSETGQMTCLR